MTQLAKYRGVFQSIDPRLVQYHDEHETLLKRIIQQIGGIPEQFVDDPSKVEQGAAPPPAASFNVTGIDGKFVTNINNPQTVQAQSVLQAKLRFHAGMNLRRTAILHNLQSATDLNFNQNSGLKDYGTSPQLMWTDQDPNVTRFFRLRSSFDGVTWNAWQVFSNALVCGPVGVWSGLQRSLADVILNVASTILGTTILTQSGTSTRINVASTQLVTGGQTLTYGAGFVDPGAYGKYFVYWLDIMRLGAVPGFTPVYIATLNSQDLTSQDGAVTAGAPITTAGGGGGSGGGGGGGGGCCIAGSMVEMEDGSQKDVRDLRKGMNIRNPLGDPEEILRIELIPGTPCFGARMSSGEVLTGFSNTHGLKYAGAGIVSGFDLVPGDVIQWRGGTKRVEEKPFLGLKTVYRMELKGPTKLYIADGAIGHNFLKT